MDTIIEYKVGDVIEVELESVAFGGEAVGRINQLVVFVKGGIDGEKVLAQITEVKKSFIRAEVQEVLSASADRVDPLCPVFKSCGGCQYQHIQYEKQLSIKQAQVKELIERIGRVQKFEILPIKASPSSYYYRSRVDLHVRKVDERLVMGYRTAQRKMLDVETCYIASKPINEAYQDFRNSYLDLQDSSKPKLPHWVRFSKFWDTPKGVRIFNHSLDGRVAFEGEPYIYQEIGGKKFRMMYDSFFQVNLDMIVKMVETIESMLELNQEDFLLDCYAGVGLFSVFLANQVKRCVGIESDQKASENALWNACENGLINTEFIGKSVEKVLLHVDQYLGEKPNKIILDPARCGCTDKVLNALKHLQPKRIVYVSCNPSTFARDIENLGQNGYCLKVVQPLDLFPQTKHCELIGLLEFTGTPDEIS